MKRYGNRYPIADDTAANRQLMRYQADPASPDIKDRKQSYETKQPKSNERGWSRNRDDLRTAEADPHPNPGNTAGP